MYFVRLRRVLGDIVLCVCVGVFHEYVWMLMDVICISAHEIPFNLSSTKNN